MYICVLKNVCSLIDRSSIIRESFVLVQRRFWTPPSKRCYYKQFCGPTTLFFGRIFRSFIYLHSLWKKKTSFSLWESSKEINLSLLHFGLWRGINSRFDRVVLLILNISRIYNIKKGKQSGRKGKNSLWPTKDLSLRI